MSDDVEIDTVDTEPPLEGGDTIQPVVEQPVPQSGPVVFDTIEDFNKAVFDVLNTLTLNVSVDGKEKWLCNGYASMAVVGVRVSVSDTTGIFQLEGKDKVE